MRIPNTIITPIEQARAELLALQAMLDSLCSIIPADSLERNALAIRERALREKLTRARQRCEEIKAKSKKRTRGKRLRRVS